MNKAVIGKFKDELAGEHCQCLPLPMSATANVCHCHCHCLRCADFVGVRTAQQVPARCMLVTRHQSDLVLFYRHVSRRLTRAYMVTFLELNRPVPATTDGHGNAAAHHLVLASRLPTAKKDAEFTTTSTHSEI
jgi:hypothetical protein